MPYVQDLSPTNFSLWFRYVQQKFLDLLFIDFYSLKALEEISTHRKLLIISRFHPIKQLYSGWR